MNQTNRPTRPIGENPSPLVLRTKEMLDQQYPRQSRDLRCPDCGAPLVLKDGKYGIFYGCSMWNTTRCGGVHNCHRDTAEPMGFPADAETRKARKMAHSSFDTLWKLDTPGTSKIPRREAYRMLSEAMNIPSEKTHIAMFTKDQCEEVIRIVRILQNGPTRFDRIRLGEDESII